jgi:hypothetical protein
MPQSEDKRWDDPRQPGTLLGDGVKRNGVDASAIRRAHMRELNLARQSAEKHYARRAPQAGIDRPTQLAAARERATELRTELARIDAEHRAWLADHGEYVPDIRPRQFKLPGSE